MMNIDINLMRPALFLFLVLGTMTLGALIDSTQVSVNKKVLTTIKNKEYTGVVLSDDGRELLFESTSIGKVYFLKEEIKSIKPLVEMHEVYAGEYSPQGPFTTRYAFTTNAMPIKKGENYTKFGLIGPEVHFALTDNLSLGLMGTWIMSPMALAAKYSFKKPDSGNPKINFSLGTLIGSSGYFINFRGYGGLHWANMTVGSPRNNFTVSAGYVYGHAGQTAKDLSQGIEMVNSLPEKKLMANGPAFSLAGIFRVGSRASIVFDSMLFPLMYDRTGAEEVIKVDEFGMEIYTYETGYIGRERMIVLVMMPGMRFQTADRSAFQVTFGGLLARFEDPELDGSSPLPMLTWFYKL